MQRETDFTVGRWCNRWFCENNGRGQKQGFGGADRRGGRVTSCYSRRYDDGGDRAITGENAEKQFYIFHILV